MKIALVQKCPSNTNYAKHLGFDNLEVFNLSSVKVKRLLKRDVDLEGFSPEDYDWVILVGSEALKMYTKVTSVTDYTGKIAPGKNGETNFIACINPGMLLFKPELKPVMEQTVASIQKILFGEGPTETKEFGTWVGITEYKEAVKYLESILDNPEIQVVGLDSETSDFQPRHGYMLGVCITHAEDFGTYIDSDLFDDELCALLQKVISSRAVVLHNAKFDIKWFEYHLKLDFSECEVHDTMLMHYVLDERQGTHGLKSLTMKYGKLGDYDRELDEFKTKYCKDHKIKQEDFSYSYIPWDIMVHYAARDPAATLTLHNKFYPLIERNDNLSKLYHELLLPGMKFINRMEERGVPVSQDRLLKGREILTERIHEYTKKLYEYPEVRKLEEAQGAAFNPNSTKQLRVLLFDFIGLEPTGKLTGTGQISTDAEVLEELGQVHEIPKLILQIRQTTKIKNTYIDKLLPKIDSDGRVRTGFNLTSTTSGRLSSSGNFNFQQLPSKDYLIKGSVKAPKGYKVVAVDKHTCPLQ